MRSHEGRIISPFHFLTPREVVKCFLWPLAAVVRGKKNHPISLDTEGGSLVFLVACRRIYQRAGWSCVSLAFAAVINQPDGSLAAGVGCRLHNCWLVRCSQCRLIQAPPGSYLVLWAQSTIMGYIRTKASRRVDRDKNHTLKRIGLRHPSRSEKGAGN